MDAEKKKDKFIISLFIRKEIFFLSFFFLLLPLHFSMTHPNLEQYGAIYICHVKTPNQWKLFRHIDHCSLLNYKQSSKDINLVSSSVRIWVMNSIRDLNLDEKFKDYRFTFCISVSPILHDTMIQQMNIKLHVKKIILPFSFSSPQKDKTNSRDTLISVKQRIKIIPISKRTPPLSVCMIPFS